MGGPHDGIPSGAEAGPQRRVLLFQLATDDVMQWCWGGAGAWYVFVDVGRLAARDFSRVDAWLECHWDADRGDPRESSASPGTGRRTRPASCPTARERARARPSPPARRAGRAASCRAALRQTGRSTGTPTGTPIGTPISRFRSRPAAGPSRSRRASSRAPRLGAGRRRPVSVGGSARGAAGPGRAVGCADGPAGDRTGPRGRRSRSAPALQQQLDSGGGEHAFEVEVGMSEVCGAQVWCVRHALRDGAL